MTAVHVCRLAVLFFPAITLLSIHTSYSVTVDVESSCGTSSEEHGCYPEGEEQIDHVLSQADPAMALVLYDENAVPPLFKAQRTFNFSGKEVVVKQNWQDVGIAAVVWDAAVALGHYLSQNPSLIDGSLVIELGAGTGLAGIVAAILGGDVSLTDLSLALDGLRGNVEANQGLHPNIKAVVSELTWGKDLHQFDAKYDVILGADIVYIRETFVDLIDTLKYLSNSETVILMSSKLRYDRDTEFYQLMSNYFSVTEVFYDKVRDIHIYSAKKLS